MSIDGPERSCMGGEEGSERGRTENWETGASATGLQLPDCGTVIWRDVLFGAQSVGFRRLIYQGLYAGSLSKATHPSVVSVSLLFTRLVGLHGHGRSAATYPTEFIDKRNEESSIHPLNRKGLEPRWSLQWPRLLAGSACPSFSIP